MAVSEFPSLGLLSSQTHKEGGRELSGCVVLLRNNHRREVCPRDPQILSLLKLAFLPSDISSYLMQSRHFQENSHSVMACEQLSRVSRFPPVPAHGRDSQGGKHSSVLELTQTAEAVGGTSGRITKSYIPQEGLGRLLLVESDYVICHMQTALSKEFPLIMPTGFCCLIFKQQIDAH